MNIVRRIVQNSLWLFGAHAGGRLLGVLVTMALTRYLGIQDFGRYSLVYAFCGIFAVMTDLGIDAILVREASRDPEDAERLLGNGLLVKAAFSLLAVVLAGVAARIAGYPAESVRLIVLASLSFFASPLTLYNAMYQVRLRMRYPALFNLAGRVLAFLFVLAALLFRGSLGAIVLALVGATFAQALITVWFSRRLFRPSFRFEAGIARRLLAQAWPLALNNLLLVLVLRVDQIMIQAMRADGDFQLGLYSAAVRYCELFNFLPAIYFASVFPLLARLQARGDPAFQRLYTLSLKYLTLAVAPVVLFTALNASAVLSLLFGEAFSGAARVLAILIGSEVFVYVTWVVVNTAISAGAQRTVPLLTLTALFVNVGLNLWRIPRDGAEGAALATLISYGMVLPLAWAVAPLRPLAQAFVRVAVRPAAGVILLGILLAFLPRGLIVSGAAILVGFPLLMILLGALGPADLALARRALARERPDGPLP